MPRSSAKPIDSGEHHVVQTPDHNHAIEVLESYADVDLLSDLGEFEAKEDAAHAHEHEDDGDDETYLEALVVGEEDTLIDLVESER